MIIWHSAILSSFKIPAQANIQSLEYNTGRFKEAYQFQNREVQGSKQENIFPLAFIDPIGKVSTEQHN
jgi:hypothetical protein